VLPKHDAHVDVRSEDGDRPQARRIVEQFCRHHTACPLTPRIVRPSDDVCASHLSNMTRTFSCVAVGRVVTGL
jgi:hypothetical protein